MGPSSLLLFLSMGSALFPISLPMGPILRPLGLGPLPSLIPNICNLPPVSGPCLSEIKRWYYNPQLKQCQKFSYCRRNSNNFMTQEDCKRACSPSALTRLGSCPPHLAIVMKNCRDFCFSDRHCPPYQRCCDTNCGRHCRLPVGAIHGYCPQQNPLGHHQLLCWTSCHQDTDCALTFPGRKCCRYGCVESCVAPVEEHPGDCPGMPILQTSAPCNDTCTDDRQCPPDEKCCFDGCRYSCLAPDRRSRCHLPAKPGPCLAVYQRYFYIRSQNRCQLFFYGCQGNANNFRSRSECQKACVRNQPDPLYE